jgi:hypothetical protein
MTQEREHTPPVTRCQSCEAPIRWIDMITKGGDRKPHPFDAAPKTGWVLVDDGTAVESRRYFVSHFATCPNAGLHRGEVRS